MSESEVRIYSDINYNKVVYLQLDLFQFQKGKHHEHKPWIVSHRPAQFSRSSSLASSLPSRLSVRLLNHVIAFCDGSSPQTPYTLPCNSPRPRRHTAFPASRTRASAPAGSATPQSFPARPRRSLRPITPSFHAVIPFFTR